MVVGRDPIHGCVKNGGLHRLRIILVFEGFNLSKSPSARIFGILIEWVKSHAL
jgi:hypothetical protein